MLVSNMLQGMFENKAAINYLVIGFLVKLFFNTQPFVYLKYTALYWRQ